MILEPHQFYYLKGVLALTATVLLILHMTNTWPTTATLGQRLRYMSLLWFSILVTYASVEQIREQASVNARNVLSLVGMVLLIVAAVVSLRENRR